jgi:hypothetical protein
MLSYFSYFIRIKIHFRLLFICFCLPIQIYFCFFISILSLYKLILKLFQINIYLFISKKLNDKGNKIIKYLFIVKYNYYKAPEPNILTFNF